MKNLILTICILMSINSYGKPDSTQTKKDSFIGCNLIDSNKKIHPEILFKDECNYKDSIIKELVKRRPRITDNEIQVATNFLHGYFDVFSNTNLPIVNIMMLIYDESRFKPNAKNPRSSAYGYWQFLRGTWNYMNKIYNLTLDKFNPKNQIIMGLVYLNHLGTKYNGNWNLMMKEYKGNSKYIFK